MRTKPKQSKDSQQDSKNSTAEIATICDANLAMTYSPSLAEGARGWVHPKDISHSLNMTGKRSLNMTDTSELESKIDELVYKMYNLDLKEIEIVES